MDKELFNDLEKEIIELKNELELIKYLENYPDAVPPEWKGDLERLIKIKERMPKIMKIMSKIKVL